MSQEIVSKDRIKEIFKVVKPYFKDKLGAYTHKRISDDWYFHGLGFVKDEMTYVFGINVGFFRENNAEHYNYFGMNFTVRSNGINSGLRARYLEFFETNLRNWILQPVNTYSSERGGVGRVFTRYKRLMLHITDDEIIDFLKDSIDQVRAIYPRIVENPDGIFDEVVRAAQPWDDTIIHYCQQFLND